MIQQGESKTEAMVAKETKLLFPAESGKLIVEKAQDVKVIPEGVERAADEVHD